MTVRLLIRTLSHLKFSESVLVDSESVQVKVTLPREGSPRRGTVTRPCLPAANLPPLRVWANRRTTLVALVARACQSLSGGATKMVFVRVNITPE